MNQEDRPIRAQLQDIVFASLYSLIVFPGVAGNAIVITIMQRMQSTYTTRNYLLMHLVVTDLLTLLLCPGFYDFALTNVRLEGFIGDLICKLLEGMLLFQSPLM